MLSALKKASGAVGNVIYIEMDDNGAWFADVDPDDSEKTFPKVDVSQWGRAMDALLDHLQDEGLIFRTKSGADAYLAELTYKGWHRAQFAFRSALHAALTGIVFPVAVSFITAVLTVALSLLR